MDCVSVTMLKRTACHKVAAEKSRQSRAGLISTLEHLAQNDPVLTHVQLDGFVLIPHERLGHSMLQNQYLVQLSLEASNFGDDGVRQLCPALVHRAGQLQQTPPLQHLNLAGNRITDRGADSLSQALAHHSTLRELILSWNEIADAGALGLASQVVSTVSTLKKLDLAGHVQSGRGGGLRDRVDKSKPQKNIHIGDVGCCALAQALPGSRLESLNLNRQAKITSQGIVALAMHVAQPDCRIFHLELQRIPVDDEGAVALARAVTLSRRIQSLQLTINSISDRGAIGLADAIAADGDSIQDIGLTQSEIEMEGLRSLLGAVLTNPRLERLDVYGHGAGRAGSDYVWQIKPWLRFNRSANSIIRDERRELYAHLLAKAGRLEDGTRLYRLLRKMSL